MDMLKSVEDTELQKKLVDAGNVAFSEYEAVKDGVIETRDKAKAKLKLSNDRLKDI